MTPETLSQSRRHVFITFALAFPLLLLVIVGLISHLSVEKVKRTSNSVRQGNEVKAQTMRLLMAMIDNETGQRGFVVSQRPEFLEPYERSLTVIPVIRRYLASQFPEGNPLESFRSLSAAMDSRLSFSARTVKLQKDGHHDASVSLIASGEGKMLMDKVRVIESQIEKNLDDALLRNEAEYLNLVARNEWISWTVVTLDCGFAFLFIWLVVRLQRAKQFLNVCAWSKTVEYLGEWITFEQYLKRRFGIDVSHGISPVEAEKFRAELDKARTN